MATKKISQLEAITEAEDSDVLVIVDVSEGTTNKITKGNLLLGSGHSVELTLDPQTYQLVLKLKNAAGTELSTQSVDLPNENAVTGIEYENGILTITKQVGEPSTVDLSPLIEGLVTESDFNTFTQTLAETIQGINETIGAINVKNGQQDEAIEENYKEITKLKSKVAEQEEIINQMPQVEDEGYEATLNDTIKAPFTLFSPEGHSEQESTEGYNVMNIKDLTEVTSAGITFTPVYNSNGSLKYINANGTATRDVAYSLMTGKTIAAGTYHVSGCPTGGSTTSYYIYTRPYNAHDTGNGCDITYDEDTIMTANNMRITIISGTTVSNQKWYPMLVSGTEEKAYEPYTNGASPNPSYEQPIKSAGENVNINSSELESGSIANGNNYESNDNIRSKDYISVQPSTNYAFSIDGTLNRVVVSMYDENKNFLNASGTEGYISSNGLFTTYSNAKYIRYRCYNADKTLFQNGKIKIEPGTTATPWSPYGMGCLTEKIVNRNLWKMSYLQNSTHGTVNNEEFTITDNSTDVYLLGYYSTSSSKIFTIKKGIYKFTSNNSDVRVSLYYVDGNSLSSLDTSFDYTTLNKDVDIVAIRARGSSSLLNKTFGLQLEQGSTANPYVPHEEQTYSIYTQQPFRSIGDVRDVFFKNTKDSEYYDENLVENGWYERHEIKEFKVSPTVQYVFPNGSFVLLNGNSIVDDAYASSNSSIAPILCTHLKANSLDNINSNVYHQRGIGVQADSHRIRAKFDDTDETQTYWTTTTVNDFISNNDIYVNYVSINPTNLACIPSQIDILENIPSTFSGQTNVFSEDEVKAYLKVAGIYDLNNLITRVEVIESEV